MADSRNHDHYVFQDLDLLGNNIENVRKVSSDDTLTLATKSGKEIISKSPAHFEKKVTIDAQSDNNSLEVGGKSLLKDNVVIGTSETDTTHTLTVAGVKIRWESDSLIFEKVN